MISRLINRNLKLNCFQLKANIFMILKQKDHCFFSVPLNIKIIIYQTVLDDHNLSNCPWSLTKMFKFGKNNLIKNLFTCKKWKTYLDKRKAYLDTWKTYLVTWKTYLVTRKTDLDTRKAYLDTWKTYLVTWKIYLVTRKTYLDT